MIVIVSMRSEYELSATRMRTGSEPHSDAGCDLTWRSIAWSRSGHARKRRNPGPRGEPACQRPVAAVSRRLQQTCS
ncbi:hypothetical protein NSPZN2_20012 [Nitrospira defluvii]|uniref:Uncharacterized protein n=1 Tax=Nitrospira defluvii TaxID=330214 RepID=A0ABM8RD37_9BACT|nr:hypothetical protein NSPZN2_20012 [Nitrospira defluvii]